MVPCPFHSSYLPPLSLTPTRLSTRLWAFPDSLALEKATHCSESPQQLRIGETDEGERHDEAEDEEEPGIVFAAVFGAHSVPVRATGALQALRDEPANRQNICYTSIILGSEETL